MTLAFLHSFYIVTLIADVTCLSFGKRECGEDIKADAKICEILPVQL
jgi:hypothetical protein